MFAYYALKDVIRFRVLNDPLFNDDYIDILKDHEVYVSLFILNQGLFKKFTVLHRC